MIEKHNANEKSSFKMSINQFFDMVGHLLVGIIFTLFFLKLSNANERCILCIDQLYGLQNTKRGLQVYFYRHHMNSNNACMNNKCC